MIPESRFVLYQGSPETKAIALYTEAGADVIATGTPLTFYAKRPGAASVAFSVACTSVLNIVYIPFTVTELANVGHFDYSLFAEPVEGSPALKLQGTVTHGTGLEIVPVPRAVTP